MGKRPKKIAAKAGGLDLNASELSRVFGIQPSTLADWVRKGCPKIERKGAKAALFNTASIFRWRTTEDAKAGHSEAETATAKAKRRKIEAEARKAELDLAVREGAQVELAAVEDRVGKMVRRFRDRILGLPSSLAREVLGAPDLQTVEGLLKQRCVEALEELGNGNG